MAKQMEARGAAAKLGLPPGSAVHVGAVSDPTRVVVTSWGEGPPQRRILAPEEAPPAPAPGRLVWVDVAGLADAARVRALAVGYGLDALLVEDILHTGQRTRVDAEGTGLFMILRLPRTGDDPLDLADEQIAVFLAEGVVLTFREHDDEGLFAPLERRFGRRGHAPSGADVLGHAVADLVVDHVFLVLERLADVEEELEALVLERPEALPRAALHRLRQGLLLVRRGIAPLRGELAELVREGHPLLGRQARHYLRDLLDHVLRAVEEAEAMRETAAGLTDAYLAALGQRTNEVMKLLSLVATVFLPLTFLAGVYGMNFEHMPELHWRWAYPAVWLVFVAVAAGLVWWFRRRGWL
ncbi:magnesium/cobalt transporter CorA [Inmirania thermothiophila]|uniref:Magnesium transport protein CorA n=1 Tax=Inmirania thermothiophila TaxID=1750597 RepID=A0A3N1YCR9_9GAMM|nr:magnesium/cobalt transporter CorA [Inmirania thermothiophila]ROR35187.1 magnesium transporter [Inmirania thermothiophila]